MGVFARGTTSSSTVITKVATGVALVASSALVLSGCAGGSQSETFPELLIGTALPQTGSLAYLGPPEEAGVALAIADINAADAGISIDVVYGDSGDGDNKAYETEIPRLLNEDVRAIIGAASSGVSLSFIDQVTKEAGVLQVSPANTSTALSDYDDDGLYWRTAPADFLQGEALGQLLAADGHETAAFLTLNDAYGITLEEEATKAFEAAGGTVLGSASVNGGDTNLTSQVNEVLALDPSALVVILFDETLTAIPEIVAGGFDSANIYMTDGNISQYGDKFPAGMLEGAKATLPGPTSTSIADDYKNRADAAWMALGNESLFTANDWAYSTESYDAVILVALASLAAQSTKSAEIAAKMQEVSGGSGNGEKCTTFAACAEIINGGGVADYDGVSGPITFADNGDPSEAAIGIYQYDAENLFSPVN